MFTRNTHVFLTIVLLALFLSVNISPANSSDKPYCIAVMDFENETGSPTEESLARVLTDTMITHFVESGMVRIVERSKTKKIVEEKALILSGLIDTDQVADVGKMLAAEYMVIGNLSRIDGKWIANARLLEVKTGRILAAEIFEADKQGNLLQRSKAATSLLLKRIARSMKKEDIALIFAVHPKDNGQNALTHDQEKRLIKVLRKKIKNYGASLNRIVRTNKETIEIILHDLSEPLELAEVLMSDDVLEFRLVQREVDPSMKSSLQGFSFLEHRPFGDQGKKIVYAVKHEPELTGKNIRNASIALDSRTNRPYIKLKFDHAGTARFAEITRTNIGKKLLIVLNGKILIAPVIQTEIGGGNAIITGNFSLDEAFRYVVNLKSGNLPASLSLSEIEIH